VHLLVNFPPAAAISRLASNLTGVPSRRLRQEFPRTGPALLAEERLWPGSYAAGPGRQGSRPPARAGRAPIPVLRQYIQQ
jgi:putative transposase